MVQRKTVMSGSGLPGKLADCAEKDPVVSSSWWRVIRRVEPPSKAETATTKRSCRCEVKSQRGKGHAPQDFRERGDQEHLHGAGRLLGTEEDERALNMTKLRYHKVVIMCDADVDGSHIETLILTFFFRHMKELIENGYVYIATPPLYGEKGITPGVCLERRRTRSPHRAVQGRFRQRCGIGVQRYKGR